MGSRRVVGFALGEHQNAQLAYGALAMAVAVRGGQVPGVIFQRPGTPPWSSNCGGKHFATRAQARSGVAAWIEDYNTARWHSALGMRSPLAYEHALASGEAA